MENRCGYVITKVQKSLHENLKIAEVSPKTYVLDNKESKELIESFTTQKIDYQFVAPHYYCK